MQLREYQNEARFQLNTLINAKRHPVFVCPTGGGKTKTATVIIEDQIKLKKRIWVLTPQDEIFRQFLKELNEYGLNAGYINQEGIKGKNRGVYVCMPLTVVNMLHLIPESLYPDIIITDECLHEDTMISTPFGLKKLKHLEIGDVVLTPSGTAKIKNKWTTRKEAFIFGTLKGNLVSSNNHLIQSNGIVNEIKNCENIDLSDTHDYKQKENDIEDNIYGWYLADGTFDNGNLKFAFRKKEKIDYFLTLENKGFFKHFVNKRGDWVFSFKDRQYKNEFIKKYNIVKEKTINEDVYKSCSISFIRGFLSGDGWRTDRRICIDQAHYHFVLLVRNMLNYYGIHPNIDRHTPKNTKHSKKHRMSIYGEDVNIYNNIIGWDIDLKNIEHKKATLKRKSTNITDTTFYDVCNLIDIELDDNDKLFFANGFIVHNCHHSAANSWETIYNFFPGTVRMGLTATPKRTDNKGLDHIYTDIVQTTTTKELIDRDFLSKPMVIVPEQYNLEVKINNGDYDVKAQADQLGDIRIIGDVIKNYETVFSGMPCLVACSTFEHAAMMTEEFRNAGWQWDHIHSNLHYKERKRMLRQIANRELNGLCTVGIGIEGLDIGGLHGLIWLRRTLSLTIYLQFIGRVLRKAEGKEYGIILDPVGNTFIHGFPELSRKWTLKGSDLKDNDNEEFEDLKMKQCGSCGVMNNLENIVCYFCGSDLTSSAIGKVRRFPSIVDGKLVVVTNDGQVDEIQSYTDNLKKQQEVKIEEKKKKDEELLVLSDNSKMNIIKDNLFNNKRKMFTETIRGFM